MHRGGDPQPGAYTQFGGEKIRFYGVSLSSEPTEEAAGTVVEVDAEGFKVAAKGGKLAVTKVRPETGGKVEAATFASEKGLRVGDRFD